MPEVNEGKRASLAAIALEINGCRACRRGKVGLPVPGEGSPDAEVVFVGEAPGKKEAASGRPFVGRAGAVLRGLICDVGLAEDAVFITSPVKYLPKHVTPTAAEVAHGRMHLLAQLEVIRPKLIVLLGRVAALAMLERGVIMAKEHGQEIDHDGRRYFLTYHPAAPLHAPKMMAPLREDFAKLKTLLS
jgi:uracil-DNA glycosylase family 4